MTIQIEFLKSVPYFTDLNADELNSLRTHIFEKTVARGEVIILEDDPSGTLFFVVSGAVKVFKTSAEGKEQILHIVRPGEPVNDVPVFDGGPSPVSAQTMTPVLLYGIDRNDLLEVLKEHPQINQRIIKLLAERVRNLMSLVEDLSFRHVIGRVAKILLEHTGSDDDPRPHLTQQEMAAIAGTAREVVARSLKTLEGDGIIRLEHHRIVITDKEALQEMAGMTY